MNHRFVLTWSAAQLIFAIGQKDTDLKTTCLLQQGVARGRELHSNEVEAGSHSEYLRNALMMVRELASNVTAWDTDLSQAERNSLDLIRSFIADLEESAVNSHDEDQREVNRAKDLIVDCAKATKTSLTEDVTPLKNIMIGSRKDHGTCRTSEGGCQRSQNKHCLEWESYRKTNVPSECAGVDFKDKMATDVKATKLDMEQCLRDLQPYYLKHIPCWQYKECVDGFAPLCDTNQTKFERDFCDYNRQLRGTCQAQTDCRQKHIAFRDETHTDVGVNEAARKADYTTAKKVLCFFKVFEANNTNKSAILQGCEKLAVNTAQLSITYPDVPAAETCVVEDKEPCSNGWEDAEYKAKGWHDDVTLLDCKPCLIPTPAPTPPPPSVWGGTNPDMWLIADDFDETQNQWPNRGNAGGRIDNVVRSGKLVSVVESGHGAAAKITAVKGTTATSINLEKLIKSNEDTMCSLTRYTGGRRGRILNGGGNWLWGHWGGRAGIAHTQRWITSHGHNIQPVDNWVVMCGQATNILANGKTMGNGQSWQMPSGGDVQVNRGGCCGGEKSDFEIAEIMVWHSKIHDMKAASQYLLDSLQGPKAPTTTTTPGTGVATNDGYLFETCIQDCGTTSKGVAGNRVCDDKQKGVDDPKKCPVWCKGMGYKKFMLACPSGGTTECWCCNSVDKANGGKDHELLDTSECTGGAMTSGLNGNQNSQCSGTPRNTFIVDGYYLGGWCRGALYHTGL